MKKFGLIGASGYIAPKHVQSIKETGNILLAAIDPHDNVGYLDTYFPKTAFFTEFERFDRHMDKLRSKNKALDYVSVCSPNYLHDTHIKSALRWGADAICEKPVVLNPWNMDVLDKLEKETGQSIWTVLQLRLHPSIVALKKKIDESPSDIVHDIDLSYISARGNWYYASWKGNHEKSGGIATNIGVHFFDMLAWVFGEVKENIVHLNDHDRSAGYLSFKKARIRWFLSINENTLPDIIKQNKQSTYRSITLQGEEINFSEGFTGLHKKVYENILSGNGTSLQDSRSAIEIVHQIRTQKPIGLKGDFHPFALNEKSPHPFFK